jgi:hypothetical protein
LPAFAQAADGEWQARFEATLVGSAINDENPLAPASDGLLASGVVTVTRSDTFDNGLTLGWRGEARYERDAPSRPAFAGVLGGLALPVLVGPATGLAAGGALLDEDGFATIEAASVSLEGPWGEGVLGLDSGVAARLDARAPTVLRKASAFSPGLDPTGLGVTRARNDVTGSSAKVTYMTPRWLGLRGRAIRPKPTREARISTLNSAGPARAGPSSKTSGKGQFLSPGSLPSGTCGCGRP